MFRRRRFKQTDPLNDHLAAFAKDARDQAALLPPGAEQDDIIRKTLEADILQMTRLLASKPDHQVLGATEFQIRDLVHQIGAKTIQAELDARQKKATKDRA